MEKRLDIRRLTLFAVLGTTMFAGKMVMAHLPNIEPVSLMVMLFAVCFGWQGLYAVAVYVALEILIWGVSLWTLPYLYVWVVLFAAARLLRRMGSPLEWALLSGAFGLAFGALCAPPHWITGGWAAAVSWWVAGIPWDILHAVGNFVIALVLFRPLRNGLVRLCREFGIRVQ